MGSSAGYIRVYDPNNPRSWSDGRIYEHVKVLLDAGIHIPDGYCVHHINEIRSDNRIENLEVLSRSDHSKNHMIPGSIHKNGSGEYSVCLSEEDRRIRQNKRSRNQYERRKRIMKNNPELVPHGIKGYRNWSCRCNICKSGYANNKRAAR